MFRLFGSDRLSAVRFKELHGAALVRCNIRGHLQPGRLCTWPALESAPVIAVRSFKDDRALSMFSVRPFDCVPALTCITFHYDHIPIRPVRVWAMLPHCKLQYPMDHHLSNCTRIVLAKRSDVCYQTLRHTSETFNSSSQCHPPSSSAKVPCPPNEAPNKLMRPPWKRFPFALDPAPKALCSWPRS